MAINRSNAITTVIQDEIVPVAYRKNMLRRQCNSDGPIRTVPKRPLCFNIVTNKHTFSVIANANSRFMITYFLREPNNTTMIMRLFATIPAVQIVRVKIVEPGSADSALLYLLTSDLLKKNNELFVISIFSLLSTAIATQGSQERFKVLRPFQSLKNCKPSKIVT